MFGNILFILTLISYGFLANLSLKPTPGGDYSVGYAFVWMFYAGGFLLFSGLLAWNMNLNHCFDWLPAPFASHRGLTVFIGWGILLLALFWSMEYHTKWNEGEFPFFMRWLALSKVHFWLPIMVFIPALYLINAECPAGFLPNLVKYSWLLGFAASFIMGLGILFAFGKFKVQQRFGHYQAAKSSSNTGDWGFDTAMDAINNYSDTSILNLLTYTHREKDERLRKAAAAKIKTYPDWEAQLIQILEKGELPDRYWVYAYMDGNEIVHSDSFVQPVARSLERLIPEIKASLKDPNSLYLGYANIEAICRVLDTHFPNNASDFRASMEQLQQVFAANPPARSNKPNQEWFDETMAASRLALGKWLREHVE
ncbi:MAG: hypothetical protein IT258_16495 [Saprospiraceae bacterium]|nr:hypothetical protein [Saprospiraceae bacterium]